jgi:hypothetical protein
MGDRLTRRRTFLTASGAALALALAAARPPWRRAGAAEDDSAAFRETMRKLAAAIRLSELTGERPGPPIPLRPEPLLRYGDEARDIHDSTLWAWGGDGRPVAVLKVERLPALPAGRRWIEGIVSLSPRRVAVTFHDGQTWTARKPGLEPAAVPDAPAPAAGEAARLTQMKALARRFSASADGGAPRGRLQLRLMAKPLCRYRDEPAGLLDGALFTFAYGTNPDVLLTLEARRSADAGTSWVYALARIGGGSPFVSLDGKEIWTQPFVYIPADQDTYVNRWVAEGDEPK